MSNSKSNNFLTLGIDKYGYVSFLVYVFLCLLLVSLSFTSLSNFIFSFTILSSLIIIQLGMKPTLIFIFIPHVKLSSIETSTHERYETIFTFHFLSFSLSHFYFNHFRILIETIKDNHNHNCFYSNL